MPCAANAYLYVNHDYEAYENEELRLLLTLKSVFLLFNVIQKTLRKKLFIIIDEQFILRVYIKLNIMYKSFRVRCDVQKWRPCVGRSRLQVRMLSDLDTLLSISG